ncbi:MAG: TIGR00282 family metallophosphoesterase [Nitrospinota bacterium]
MKILFIGDIVGKVGRRVLSGLLHKVIDQYKVDFCIANCENAAGGFGINVDIARTLLDFDINILTSGNHIWNKKEALELLTKEKRILRPANYPEEVPGRGSMVTETASGDKIGIINLSGRVFMDSLDCPFKVAVREIENIGAESKVIVVDMHAEATSEKVAMGWYLDGRVSAVIGTHTHVQTADVKILPGGTAYITDIGMTGPSDSVIGIKKELAIQRFLTRIPKKFETAKGIGQLNGVIVEIAQDSGVAKGIERIQIGYE